MGLISIALNNIVKDKNKIINSIDADIEKLNDSREYAKKALTPAKLKDNSRAMNIGGTVYEGRYNLDTLVNWIEENGDYKDWAVLCYTNAEVNFIMRELKDSFIPVVNFNQRQKTKKEIDDLVNQNKVKVLTVWGAKGLGFPNVVVYGRNWMIHKRTKAERDEGARINYVAYTRAMDSLIVFN